MNTLTNPRCPRCLSEKRQTTIQESDKPIHGLVGRSGHCDECDNEWYIGEVIK